MYFNKQICFWIIIFAQFLTSCLGSGKNKRKSYSKVPAISSQNVIQLKGLENRPTNIPVRAGLRNQVQKFTENKYTPPPEALRDTTTSQLPVIPTSSPVRVVITFKDESSGTVKKIVSGVGVQSFDLSGIPDGVYLVTAEVEGGFEPPSPKKIEVKNGKFDTFELSFAKIEHDHFYYYWESDNTGREFEYSANENVTPIIEILNENVETPLFSSVQILKNKYNIVLGNKDLAWPYEFASILLRSIESIPHEKLSEQALFTLTDKEINNDIQFKNDGDGWSAVLSSKAFENASKKLVKLNDKKGHFFSKRLLQSLVYFFTNNGRNQDAVEKILMDKFAVTTNVPDYHDLTGENEHSFQAFHFGELVQIINAFSEMPSGYYKIKGLRYLLRRKDGHPHPRYPEAPAVAWPNGPDNDSYIEFMESAFKRGGEDYTHRLILHEKSHFLWKNVFSQSLQKDWITLGNWFENTETTSGWSTYDTTAFVSAYAHSKNPNEDMAEALSYYVLNPNKLLSLAQKKFDFIEKRIMNGYRYVSQIRDDLTFEVLNLFPDYDFPGKIRKVIVAAKGDPNSDKEVSFTIELTDKEGIEDSGSSAFTRITSPDDTFKDLHLSPVKGNGHLLRGRLSIPKNAKSGYWTIQNITITDTLGNERHEGIVDFGFKLYINNQVEDRIAPQYIADSINITAQEESDGEGRQVFRLRTTWEINENMEMHGRSPVYANVVSPDYPELYSIKSYGVYNKRNRTAQVDLMLTEHHPEGRYGASYIMMQDQALNKKGQYFSNNPEHEPINSTSITPRDPDYDKPTLDLNRIYIQASPLNPSSPDGSTNVEIVFYARDNKSGLGVVNFTLVDPLGKGHFDYFYHENSRTLFFKGDPMKEKEYRIRTTLPKGSPPGKWGFLEIVLHDKAGNTNTYNFLETMHFQVVE